MFQIRIGHLVLQPHRQLLRGSERVALGKRALDILSVLAEAEGEIVTKDELLEAVWPGVVVEENALQVHVTTLRKALGAEADRLKTIRGIGYRLETDGEAAGASAIAIAQSATDDDGEPPRARGGSGEVAPAAGLAETSSPVAALWTRVRTRRLAWIVGAFLVCLFGAWAFLGGGIGTESGRIPVVVRSLAASGTGDRTEATLASGITDELIVRLRRIPELRIGTAQPDGSVTSDEFEKAYIVDGNIRSSGDRLRVTARLIDANGEILWSQTFNRTLRDLFEVQELIASSIAGALSVPLDVGASSVAYGGTNNPEAYAAFVLGQIHGLDFDQSVPVRYYQQAITLDPDFVQAHANLASTYGNRIPVASTAAEVDRMMAEMDMASARALQANPDLWVSNVARGWYDVTQKDLSSAEKRMRRAAELDRGIDPQLRDALAQYAVTLGRARKALAISESKALIDPIYENAPPKIFLLTMNGRHRQSADLFDKLAGDEHQSLQAYVFHVFWARVLAGEAAEAIAFVRGLNMPVMAAVAEELRTFEQESELLQKNMPELRRWADETYGGHGGQFPIANLALVAAYRGHQRLAVDLLRLAFERPGGYALFYLWHPAMAEARKTDAFEQLVTDLGFVKVWRESGDWGDFCRPASGTAITCT